MVLLRMRRDQDAGRCHPAIARADAALQARMTMPGAA